MRPKSSGLKWRRRAGGGEVPYWFPDVKSVESGFRPKSVNLQVYAENESLLIAQCQKYQRELANWRAGLEEKEFDDTFGSLFNAYETDKHSSFQAINSNTRQSYTSYLKVLKADLGGAYVDATDGRRIKDLFADWRAPKEGSDVDRLPRARMIFAVLKAAVSFGVMSRFRGCAEFQTVIGELSFPMPQRRREAPTAAQIIAARNAAHAAGRPLRALAYALQFETTLRQGDVIGQWVPMSDPRPSEITYKGEKWIGLRWSDLNKDGIVERVEPSKTHLTTKVRISFDLTVCPMVMEELSRIDLSKAAGPMIINEKNGRPYRRFASYWREDFEAAEIPKAVWGRDLRAAGITEGGKAGASKDDRRKLAGHANEETTEIYDRDTVEAHRRVMQARKVFRDKNSP